MRRGISVCIYTHIFFSGCWNELGVTLIITIYLGFVILLVINTIILTNFAVILNVFHICLCRFRMGIHGVYKLTSKGIYIYVYIYIYMGSGL